MSSAEPSSSSVREPRSKFPGDELVEAGLADLAAGRRSVESLLLAAAGPRLARVGVALPEHNLDTSGRELYKLLEADLGVRAHARYNALHRLVISYCVAKGQDALRR